MADEEPKLIIDTDWKAQAQAEKDRLAAQAPAGKSADAKGAPGGEEPIRFDDIVRMFAMQALSYLGDVPDPRTGQRVLAPEYARMYIDMLEVLDQKTKNNLTPDEASMLQGILGDLRMAYVDVTKALAKAVAEGKIKPMSPGSPGPAGGLGVAPSGKPPTPPSPGPLRG